MYGKRVQTRCMAPPALTPMKHTTAFTQEHQPQYTQSKVMLTTRIVRVIKLEQVCVSAQLPIRRNPNDRMQRTFLWIPSGQFGTGFVF